MRAAGGEYGAAGCRLSGGHSRRVAVRALESGDQQYRWFGWSDIAGCGPSDLDDARQCSGSSTDRSAGCAAELHPVGSAELGAVDTTKHDAVDTTKHHAFGATEHDAFDTTEFDTIVTAEHDADYVAQLDAVSSSAGDDAVANRNDWNHEPAAARHQHDAVTIAGGHQRHDRYDGITCRHAARISSVGE